MPIFAYVCQECSHHFETIVQGSTVSECPACRARNLEKLLSAFAVGGSGGNGAVAGNPGSCGTCGDPRGPGACSLG